MDGDAYPINCGGNTCFARYRITGQFVNPQDYEEEIQLPFVCSWDYKDEPDPASSMWVCDIKTKLTTYYVYDQSWNCTVNKDTYIEDVYNDTLQCVY